MTAAPQGRQPKGIPTGGQFAPDTHAEPDIRLGGYAPATINIGSLGVENYSFRGEPMPEWPASLPAPQPWFDFDDGRPVVFVEVDGHEHLKVWKSDNDELLSSFDDDASHWDEVDEGDRDQALEYGQELLERVDGHTYGVMLGACNAPGVKKAILDDCLDREPEPDPERTYRELALDRAGRAIEAAGTSGDPETDLADMLANLRHFADRHGLDFGEIDGRAYRYYSDEVSDPDFDTTY